MPGPRTMPPGMVARLRAAAQTHAGLHLGSDKGPLLTTRVLKRMRELEISDFSAYEAHFKADPHELQQFINAVTTNTTAFFREPAHFDRIAAHLGARIATGQRRFRLWCAAASTGEEPYTLAMVLHRHLAGHRVDLSILGTDIDTRALAVAHRGVYPEAALAKVPAPYRAAAFRPHPDGVVIAPEVRRQVRFARLNLNRTPYPLRGPLDVILCRNVMLYFGQPTRLAVTEQFQRLLSNDALLIVGVSESLRDLDVALDPVEPSIYAPGRAA